MSHAPQDLIDDTSAVSLRHWILPALILSFLFHGALFYFFGQKNLDHFAPSDSSRLVPRTFNISRVQIDPKMLEPDSKPIEKTSKVPGDLGTIKDLKQFDGSFAKDIQEFRATPEVNSPESPQLNEKPGVDMQSTQIVTAQAKAESARAMEK